MRTTGNYTRHTIVYSLKFCDIFESGIVKERIAIVKFDANKSSCDNSFSKGTDIIILTNVAKIIKMIMEGFYQNIEHYCKVIETMFAF